MSDETRITFEDVYEFEFPDYGYSVYYFTEDRCWIAERWDESEDALILEDDEYTIFDRLRVVQLYGDELTIEEFEAMKEAVNRELSESE